jgi:hypothetical protein
MPVKWMLLLAPSDSSSLATPGRLHSLFHIDTLPSSSIYSVKEGAGCHLRGDKGWVTADSLAVLLNMCSFMTTSTNKNPESFKLS